MVTVAALPDRWITDWERSDRMPFYTRANAGEVLPDPTSPLGWTLVFEKGLLPGWLRGMVEFGIYRDGELPMDRPPVVGTFGGYFYINLSHCRVMAIRMGMTVEAFDAALLGSADVAPPYKPHPEDVDADASAKVGATIGEILGATTFPKIDADLARVLDLRRNRPDLTSLSEAELIAHARTFLPELDNAFAVHDYSTLGSAVGPAMLGELCAAAGAPDALLELISGLGEVPSASPSWGLWQLSRAANADPRVTELFDAGPAAVQAAVQNGEIAEFGAQFDTFLAMYGQRGPNEWDIRAVSWEAGPEQALALVDSMRHTPDDNSPDDRHERLAATRLAAAEQVRAGLAGDDTRLATFEVALQSAARTIPLREQTKLIAVTTINEVRMAIRELGRRGVEAGRYDAPEDVMMLLESELDDYVADPAPFVGSHRRTPRAVSFAFRNRAAVHRRRRSGAVVGVEAPNSPEGGGGDRGRGTARHRRQRRAVHGHRTGGARPAGRDGARTRRGAGGATHRRRLDAAVPGCRRRRRRRGGDEQPRRRRLARTRHPVRAVARGRHRASARRHAAVRRRHRRHRHGRWGMNGRFEGKVAFVTGGASGLGAAAAQRFSDEGAQVAVR